MTKCDNCPDSAEFVHRPSKNHSQNFCRKHVPWFLKSRIAIGALERVEEPEAEAVAPKTSKKRKATQVDEQQPDSENTDEAGPSSPEDSDEDGSVPA